MDRAVILSLSVLVLFFFFQAEDGIRDSSVTGVQTCALPICFGLVRITLENGPIEIAPGTHRMPRKEALRAVEAGEIGMQTVPLEIGDVLIRHPWALNRASPNSTDTPPALARIRYARPWYAHTGL